MTPTMEKRLRMTFAGRLKSPWLWLIAAAWAFLVATEVTGLSAAGDHHALIEGDRWPWGVSLAFFALFWLVMVAAMMLPMNLPMLDALRRGTGGGSPTTAAFLAGYSGVWAAFGAAVFVGDTGVHSLTHSLHWLHENGWAVLAVTLAVVGLFQLAPAKRRYLEECRHRTDHIARHPGGGWVGALAQGLRYGRCELLCCWALMLLVGRRRARPGVDPRVHRGNARGEDAAPRRAVGSAHGSGRGVVVRCRRGRERFLAVDREPEEAAYR